MFKFPIFRCLSHSKLGQLWISEDSENKFLMTHMIMKKPQRTMTPWVKPGNQIETKKYDGNILSLQFKNWKNINKIFIVRSYFVVKYLSALNKYISMSFPIVMLECKENQQTSNLSSICRMLAHLKWHLRLPAEFSLYHTNQRNAG